MHYKFLWWDFREGITAVMEPIDCPNVSFISCKYASMFQEFLLSSNLPVWNRIENTGFWRQLTVSASQIKSFLFYHNLLGLSFSQNFFYF